MARPQGKYMALCNDCLRIVPLASRRAVARLNSGKRYCTCGGSGDGWALCACGSCLFTARMLLQGCRDPRVLNLNPTTPAGFKWTADQGIQEVA